jgi:hypothetical protein
VIFITVGRNNLDDEHATLRLGTDTINGTLVERLMSFLREKDVILEYYL